MPMTMNTMKQYQSSRLQLRCTSTCRQVGSHGGREVWRWVAIAAATSAGGAVSQCASTGIHRTEFRPLQAAEQPPGNVTRSKHGGNHSHSFILEYFGYQS